MQHYNDKLQAVTTLTLKVTSWQCVCIRASDRKLCENTEVILQQRRILNGNTSEEPSGVFPEQKSVALRKIGFHPLQGRDRQRRGGYRSRDWNSQEQGRDRVNLWKERPLQDPDPKNDRCPIHFFLYTKDLILILQFSVTRLILIELLLLHSTVIYIYFKCNY